MTEKLLDLSNKIDAAMVSVCEPIVQVMADTEICGFVVGATARDIMLHYVHGIPVLQATGDIDFGIQVHTWRQYETLKENLIKTGLFDLGDSSQRLVHKSGVPIDIIPYGSLARENGTILWPPDNSSEMSVLGYEDAYRCSQRIRLRAVPPLEIRIATPAGISILKLIAWFDDPDLRKRDAKDLAYIINWYLDLGNHGRLFGEHADILEMARFDTLCGGARLLGRDIAEMSSGNTKQRLLEVLERETKPQRRYRLVEDMLVHGGLLSFDAVLASLKELKQGIEER